MSDAEGVKLLCLKALIMAVPDGHLSLRHKTSARLFRLIKKRLRLSVSPQMLGSESKLLDSMVSDEVFPSDQGDEELTLDQLSGVSGGARTPVRRAPNDSGGGSSSSSPASGPLPVTRPTVFTDQRLDLMNKNKI